MEERCRIDLDIQSAEDAEILECLKALLNIRSGTQPADREFGISWNCLDYPPEVAESMFLVELEDKVAKYEPRVEIKEVTFSVSPEDGKMTPHIVFCRKEESA